MNNYSNLHILADFDGTLSRPFTESGERIPGIISVVRKSELLGTLHAKKADELFNYYWPIEHDPLLSKEDKVPYMEEWRTKANNSFVEYGFNKSHIDKIFGTGKITFRDGREKFFSFLETHKIPLTIYSACGIGTASITQFLQNHNLTSELINIISNDFNRDAQGNATSVKGRVMHTYNKDTFPLTDYNWFQESLKNRKQALVLGDSLGDVDIGKKESFDSVTTVGFLNKKDPDKNSLEAYQNTFDYHYGWDAGFDEIMTIIQSL